MAYAVEASASTAKPRKKGSAGYPLKVREAPFEATLHHLRNASRGLHLWKGGLEGSLKGASRKLEGGFKGASRDAMDCFGTHVTHAQT